MMSCDPMAALAQVFSDSLLKLLFNGTHHVWLFYPFILLLHYVQMGVENVWFGKRDMVAVKSALKLIAKYFTQPNQNNNKNKKKENQNDNFSFRSINSFNSIQFQFNSIQNDKNDDNNKNMNGGDNTCNMNGVADGDAVAAAGELPKRILEISFATTINIEKSDIHISSSSSSHDQHTSHNIVSFQVFIQPGKILQSMWVRKEKRLVSLANIITCNTPSASSSSSPQPPPPQPPNLYSTSPDGTLCIDPYFETIDSIEKLWQLYYAMDPLILPYFENIKEMFYYRPSPPHRSFYTGDGGPLWYF